MKKIIFGTTAGALVGAAISMAVPCCDVNFKNKIFKKGKRFKRSIVKRVAHAMYKMT